MQIAGSVALITGAASGIGRATAELLAGEGAKVAVVDLDEGGGHETVARIRTAGGEARFVRGDVSSPRGIEDVFKAVVAELGVPRIVFNNAGIMTGDTPGWPESGLEKVHQVVSVNAAGVIMGTRQAVDVMRGSGGVVINTASIAAFAPLPRDAVYGGTKALVVQFTVACAELAETHGVRVNAVLPGVVQTPILAKTGDGETPAAWLVPLLEQANIIEPAVVANCVLGLIRDDGAAGVCRVIDGDGERDIVMTPTETRRA